MHDRVAVPHIVRQCQLAGSARGHGTEFAARPASQPSVPVLAVHRPH
jgi:hypothetical protein